jgi:hypothetical protein
MARAKLHYINNPDFYKSMVDWLNHRENNLQNNLPLPKVPEYVGECFLKIAERLSFKLNFMKYPFREEMVADAVENSLRYAHKFNPQKTQNPFAYFTRVTINAFLRRIHNEKTQLYIKYKYIQNSSEFSDYVNQPGDDSSYDNTYIQFLRKNMVEIITDFEEKKIKEKQKKIKSPGKNLLNFDFTPGNKETDDIQITDQDLKLAESLMEE